MFHHRYRQPLNQFIALFLYSVLFLGTFADAALGQRVEFDETVKDDRQLEQTSTPCGGEFKTAGNDQHVDGPDGNIRMFGGGGISVKASAFARRNSDGGWEAAYLGAYSSGLGVTDSGETGNGETHKVDNVGDRKNYVLFEFDQQVIVDRAFVDAIGGDSDITVWVGNAADPYNNHITLNDTLLSGYGASNHDSTGTTGHWVDVNSTNEAGNVLVIAARVSHSDDQFKIEALDVSCIPSPCPVTTIETTGNAPGSGSYGNILTFASGTVNVKASAFSRRRSDGLWQTAYLGAFSSGLGVTDRAEGNGDNDRHKVDNIDRLNYVLFEFDQDVVIDAAYLDSIGADSDISVWIGSSTDPYNDHLTLSDALLTGFGSREDNDTTSSSPRWADINSISKVGNVLVVAASTSDTSPEDAFKIRKIKAGCPSPNRANVTIIKEVLAIGGATLSTQSFGYTATNLGTPNFNLVDLNAMGSDRFVNPNITAFGASNPITVTESLTTGWTLADLACVETGGVANTTVDFSMRTATIIAEPGESITCTYRNTQLIPSAAHVKISGRAVTVDGLGISGATLTLLNASSGEIRTARTNPFGYYEIEDLDIGTFYMLTIAHKRHSFVENTRSFTISDDLTSVDFVEGF